MPAVLVLQKGNAGALVGFGDDGQRPFVEADAHQNLDDFLEVVAVFQRFHAPAERFKTLGIND
jgi:hypothetical protein